MASELHSGHRDRMKTKFRKNGIECFEDHEKLEVLLYSIFSRIDTNELSHNLINNFGSLSNVLNAPESQLKKIKGISETSAFQINYIGALIKYISTNDTSVGICLDTTKKIDEYARNVLDLSTEEQVLAMFLDKKHMLISKIIVKGCSTCLAESDCRVIIKRAVEENTMFVVLVHSHLDSNLIPSTSDILATRNIYASLTSVGIQLDDHVIIDKDDYFSMRSSGVLPDLWKN